MIIELLSNIIKETFNELNYETTNLRVIKSNRPDLCDFQCDEAFKLAKSYHKNPIEIGEQITEHLNKRPDFNEYFKEIEFVKPGFINIKLSDKFINKYLKEMNENIKSLLRVASKPETFVIDFGGANVAKPLHVGHMRTIMVGESIQRTIQFMGHKTIGDVHLGDYGLQIGQVIYGVLRDKLKDEDINVLYLEKIYPEMSGICKEDEKIKEDCAEITKKLQEGNELYHRLWRRIVEVSVADIKKNYDFLGANFDYWYGESDSYDYLSKVEDKFNQKGILKESRGAYIVEVQTEEDKKEIPPLLFKKSNGAYLYASTDLGTIEQRIEDFNPDHILYVVDSRQSLHFEQVFRSSEMGGLIPKSSLEHLGYGTVNGEDGKPYKTRNGDNPKLEGLFEQTRQLFISKKESNKDMSLEDVNKIANAILKFADLQNCREKDYIFDLNKFSDVSGKTGPYILYTYLRINKILKEEGMENVLTDCIYNKYDRDLRLKMLDYPTAVETAFETRMPHYIAEYVYNLCVACNIFYQNNHINGMEDETNKKDWLYILALSNKIIKEMLNLLAIEIPSVM
ncbi:MAG: arginine--tRNA ligase [Bacilli bacterium]